MDQRASVLWSRKKEKRDKKKKIENPGIIENTTLFLKKLGLVPPYTNQYLISNMFVYFITDDKQLNKRLLHDNFPLIL